MQGTAIRSRRRRAARRPTPNPAQGMPNLGARRCGRRPTSVAVTAATATVVMRDEREFESHWREAGRKRTGRHQMPLRSCYGVVVVASNQFETGKNAASVFGKRSEAELQSNSWK